MKVHIGLYIREAFTKFISAMPGFDGAWAKNWFAMAPDGGEPFVFFGGPQEQHCLLHNAEAGLLQDNGRKVTNTDQQQSEDEEPEYEEPPAFTEGRPEVVLAADSENKPCFALLLTESMAEAQNDISVAVLDLQKHESALEKVNIKEMQVQRSLENAKANEKNENEELPIQTKQIQTKLDTLRERKDLLEKTVATLENSIESDKTRIQEAVESAMKEAGLLKEPRVPEIDSMSEDSEETENFDSPTGADEPTRPKVSEEEQAILDARQDFWDAQVAYQEAQVEFDRKEFRYEYQLKEWEAEVATGECDMTRSEFDCRNLALDQQLTGALIDAEEAFYFAKDQANDLGCFDDGWGQESYYGDSERTEQSYGDGEEPENGWRSYAMGETPTARIEAWINTLDPLNSSNAAIIVDLDDDWDSRSVELWDSLSCVDYDKYAREIVRWESHVDQNREDWQLDKPEAEDPEADKRETGETEAEGEEGEVVDQGVPRRRNSW